jgi:type I restriction enzyme M protein
MSELYKNHSNIISFIWKVADKLRGPYRPPQYRRVMLPMTVLRRLDCVLEPTKNSILKKYEALQAKGLTGKALETALEKEAVGSRTQSFYNISPFTFQKLIDDHEHIKQNLTAYINGFSPTAKAIFENFKFESEIEKLQKADRLYLIVKDFADLDLNPAVIPNIEMGYIFEELIRKFNEQANEEAGDHFTPREVIRLMTQIIFTGEEDIYTPGISRTVYDPACGTGGMLSISEEFIRKHNEKANITLYGQEYNDESYAICTSDLLIKDEEVDNIIFGDTLGSKESGDGHPGKTFHYMLANPPFGVEWKPEEDIVKKEHKDKGFDGRFGPGLPRINDGSLLFLLHMISKMKEPPDQKGDGSKIAIVFNGSPLFTGDAGSGESNIRRWIIENDWLDAVVALPDQLFYNTGIYTYIWFVTNKKPAERKGKVQLIDGTKHFEKMKKSLGNKRNELSEEQIAELTNIYAEFTHNAEAEVTIDGMKEKKVCSKIFMNQEFGYLKVTVERPLRLNFCINEERIARLEEDQKFTSLAVSKKKKDLEAKEAEEEAGRTLQEGIINTLKKNIGDTIYKNRDDFIETLNTIFEDGGVKLNAKLRGIILDPLSEQDETADICYDSKGNIEPDKDLRDTENIPLPVDIELPLPLGYDNESGKDELIELVKEHCEEYMEKEVLPHVPDAWIDYSKIKVGYEIPLNRHFYVYQPPRPLEEIEKEIATIEQEMEGMLKDIIK